MPAEAQGEDRDWQRLDKWLWCARFMKARADCARLVAGGSVRINRRITDKPAARLRIGDVLTLPLPREVRVVEVVGLAARRGPAAEASGLYREITARAPAAAQPSCHTRETASYAAHIEPAQSRCHIGGTALDVPDPTL